MSATERVRELLDERGVEYTANERDTQWWPKDNPAGVLAENSRYPHGTLDVYGLTPEQAVAATLGRGTCRAECFDDGVDEGVDGEWFSYSPPTWYLSCGHEVHESERPEWCPWCGKKVVDE